MTRTKQPAGPSKAETLPWLLVGVLALGALILVQQWGVWLSSSTMSGAGERQVWESRISQPGLDQLTITSKALVRLHSIDEESQTEFDVEQTLDELTQSAMTAAEELRVALVAGHLQGPESAIQRLEELDGRLDLRAELRGDVRWFRELFERATASADGGTPVDTQDVAGLEVMRARHGWFTDLAIAELRGGAEELTGGGLRLVGVLLGVGLVHLLVSLLAIVVGIWAVIQFIRRDEDAIQLSTDVEPAYLQASVLFLIGAIAFAGLGAMAWSSTGNAAVVLFAASEVAVWVAGLAVIWPRLRGVPGMVFRSDTGWTVADTNLFKEIGWGFVGFCVSTAVTMVLGIVVGIVMTAIGTEETAAEAVDLPLFDSPIAPTWPLLLLGGLTAVLWAPFFEELVFRGCLFAWLRPKLGMWATVAVTAAAFGAIHPYSIVGMLMVASGGVVYALLREWRGSLVAPIVAHMLHNGLITATEIAVIAAID